MDGELRRLRARYVASQTDEDKALWLRARVRAGEQDEESLRVGVWLGDEVAREVGAELLGDDAVTLVASKSGFAKLLEGLPGGSEVQKRALRAAFEAAPFDELAPAFGEALAALLAYEDDPTPERRQQAQEARRALGRESAGSAAFYLVMALEAFQEIVTDGWTARASSLAARALGWAFASHARSKAIREAVIAALLPWVYLRTTAPAPSRSAAVSEQEGALDVFSPSAMTPDAAAAVLALAPAKRPTTVEARAVVEAYLLALGWRVKLRSLLHPDGQLRVQLSERVLRLEVGGPGKWRRPADNAGRQIGLVDVALRLIEGARRRG